ncbi:GtrA family protein [bacterium]|nr:GtrA family protein [bacterium]
MIKREFIKFIFIGILNTIVGYSLYVLFIYLGFDYKIAAFLAMVLGVLFNFQTIGRLVFDKYNNRLLFKFISVYVVIYFVGVVIIKIGKSYGLDDYLAGFIAVFPSAIISFLLNKFYVYKEKM